MASVKYSELTREVSIDGSVNIVQVYIDIKSRVRDTIILSGVPNSRRIEAAIEAVREMRFTPAMQRDRAIAPILSMGFRFGLGMWKKDCFW